MLLASGVRKTQVTVNDNEELSQRPGDSLVVKKYQDEAC